MSFENKTNNMKGFDSKPLQTTEELKVSVEQENNPELKVRLEKLLGNSEKNLSQIEEGHEKEVMEVADLRISALEISDELNEEGIQFFAEALGNSGVSFGGDQGGGGIV